MQKQLLTRLLKVKKTENEKIEKLIEELIAKHGHDARIQSEKFLADLMVLILKERDIPKEEILQIAEVKLKNFTFATDTEGIEDLYRAIAIAALPKATFVFNKIDTKVVEAMYQNYFWLSADASENLQDAVRKTIKEAFAGEIPVNKLGSHLKDQFGGITDETERYFQGVSDHIIRQSQNIARVKQYEKNGITKVQIDAVMDDRTSEICRSMNGRVIEVSRLSKQADKIMAAKNVEAKKKSSEWRSVPYLGKSNELPTSFGLPPYHFRCRTGIKPFYEFLRVIEGGEAKGSKLPGEKYNGGTVAFSHVDKTGKEIIITENDYEHINSIKHNVPKKDIIKALNSIEQIEKHADGKKYSARTANEYYISFEGNRIKTMFKPGIGIEKYFKKHIKLIDGERNLIKWLKELLS